MYMYIYAHKYYIYTHIRIYTCIYIYVYIYIYAFLFNMLEAVVWGQSKFFPIYFDSPNDLEICLSFFAISFYRICAEAITQDKKSDRFCFYHLVFYILFFFSGSFIHHYVFLSTFHIASYLGNGHFRNIECKHFRWIEIYSFPFCIIFRHSK